RTGHGSLAAHAAFGNGSPVARSPQRLLPSELDRRRQGDLHVKHLPLEFSTSKGRAVLRRAAESDIDALVALNKLCFSEPGEQNVVWTRAQLKNHLRLFPEGQHVVELGGDVVGAAASLIVHLGTDPYRAHTYAGITD